MKINKIMIAIGLGKGNVVTSSQIYTISVPLVVEF